MDEQLKTILGESITDENVTQLTEAVGKHVEEKLLEQKIALTESHTQALAAQKEEIEAAVSARVDECVELAVNSVIEEHEAKFVQTEAFDKMNKALGLIKEAFEANGFVLVENAAEVALTAELTEAKVDYQTLFAAKAEADKEITALKEELQLAKMTIIFGAKTDGLADTIKEKVGTLAESVAFESLDQYSQGLDLIIKQASTAPIVEAEEKKEEEEESDEGDKGEKKDDKKKDKKNPFVKEDVSVSTLNTEDRMALYKSKAM